ncbi:hypothetical protein, partial [Shewanella sp.]|uniref:hypothetical protein n=1 Tax=Shewanella sp. TaxID=50422 RepID=UPI003A96F16E
VTSSPPLRPLLSRFAVSVGAHYRDIRKLRKHKIANNYTTAQDLNESTFWIPISHRSHTTLLRHHLKYYSSETSL